MTRGAAYLRTSKESSDEARQRSSIQSWLRSTGRVLGPTDFFFDAGWRRHQVRPEFSRLLDRIQAGQLDWVVVEEQTRWGTEDAYQFVAQMGLLRKHNVELWEARTGRLLNPSASQIGDFLTGAIGAIQSTEETSRLATRNLKAKLLKAQQGCWMGGPIPYGLGIVCKNANGSVLWTVERVKNKLEQHYPDGRIVYRNSVPQDRNRKEGDSLFLCPSNYVERLEIVRLIFQWATKEAISPGAICNRLNTMGKRTAEGTLWSWSIVASVLTQPNYTGAFSYGKVSRARHATHSTGTDYRLLDKPIYVHKPQSEWITSESIFEPIISREVWELAQQKFGQPRPKAIKNPEMWLSGLVFCGACGSRMSGWQTKNKPFLKYGCDRYRRFGTASGCRCHQASHETLARMTLDYLHELGGDLSDLTLTSLYRKRAKGRARYRELRTAVDRILYDTLPDVYEFTQDGEFRTFLVPRGGEPDELVRLPGCTNGMLVENLFAMLESRQQGSTRAQLRELRARHDKLTSAFVEASTPMLRQKLQADITGVEAEIGRLEAGLTSISTEIRCLFQGLHQFAVEASRAAVVLADEEPRRRAAAARRVLERVECRFRVDRFPSGYERAVLDSVWFVPKIGQPELRKVQTPGPPCDARSAKPVRSLIEPSRACRAAST